MSDLKGKVAVVTGASKGTGRGDRQGLERGRPRSGSELFFQQGGRGPRCRFRKNLIRTMTGYGTGQHAAQSPQHLANRRIQGGTVKKHD
jgi:hypothetical protein